jgi:hypothetical protein
MGAVWKREEGGGGDLTRGKVTECESQRSQPASAAVKKAHPIQLHGTMLK